jgi:hypothetical protein
MTDAKDIQKLRALLPRWIRHNTAHGDEYRMWVYRSGRANIYLEAAAAHCEDANFMLQKALEQIGGPLENKAKHKHSLLRER